MDFDPDLAWPFWKFGLKKDDLFTKLHDQYNTFPSSIQDPEAFHHDVYECSQDAHTAEQFHRLLATRKEQRLRELNTSLESASLEIISNPSLIGTEQWQYALQLFRTKSLDSLVRYFSSYLPDNHQWQSDQLATGPSAVSDNDVKSKIHSSTSDEPTFFDDSDYIALMTHEPEYITGTNHSHLPPSPRSMTMCSDESRDGSHCDGIQHTYNLHNLTPARTLSFSESESERFTMPSSLESSEHLHHDESQPESPISMYSEAFSEIGFEIKLDAVEIMAHDNPLETTASQLFVEDDVHTPTPKPEAHAGPFFDLKSKPSPANCRGHSMSPSRTPHPLAQVHSAHTIPNEEQTRLAVSSRLRRRDHSPGRGRRRSPGEPASRIQKSLPGHVGSRHRGRRRMEEC